jgi:hypothetical protein
MSLLATSAPVAAVPLHLGDLHGYEQVLVWAVAFGPFVVLAVVVHLVRRRDVAAEEQEAASGSAAGTGEPGLPDRALAVQRLDEDPLDE